MTHWKQQLPLMHRQCNIKKCLLVVLCWMMFLCASCTQKHIETISLAEWIHMLNAEAGIYSYDSQTPYFLNVTEEDACYEDVQAAVEWKVLDPQFGFQPDASLDRQLTAYTLMNLVGKEQSETLNISDITNSIYKSQIQAAVSSGLMQTDARNMFHPQDLIDKDEAEKLLKKAVQFLNHREIEENTQDIQWTTNGKSFIEIEPIDFDEEAMCILVGEDTQVEAGDLIHFTNALGDQYYEVASKEGTLLYLQEVDLFEQTESMDLQGSTQIDFSDALIIDGDEAVVQESAGLARTEQMALKPLQKTLHYKDYAIVLTTNGTRIKAEMTKTLPHGSQVYASIKLNGVNVDYQWKSKKKDVKDAYFKVKMNAQESFGLKNGAYKNLYGDFSKIDQTNFVSTLKNLFQEKQDVVESTLELCKIRVPIPNAPLLNVTIALNLNMHASGRAEMYFTQTGMIGCEIREGKMRMIQECNNQVNNRLKANAGIGAGITFGLHMTSIRLLDAAFNIGQEATLSTSFHIYQDDTHTIQKSDVSYDVAEELAENHPDVLVCSDVSANLRVYLKVNSAKSQLGKLGFTNRIDLVKQSLVPKGKKHMENFQFVQACTREEREKKVTIDTLKVTKKICLKEYSMIVRQNKDKQITITGLPEGYTQEDLVFTTSDPDVATVLENGIVSAHKSGSAVITVTTLDGKHYIKCNVVVPEVKE